MSHTLRFNGKYFVLTLFIFLIEICIGVYMKDSVIRPYGGDYLVVILLYCFLKSFLNIPVLIASTSVLIFSYFIEFLQYLQFADRLGLSKKGLMRILLGDYFTWNDILSYTLGIITVILIETLQRQFYTRINKKRSRFS